MAVISGIVFSIFLLGVADGQFSEAKCKKQLEQFHACRTKMFVSKEQEERLNKSNALFEQCFEKNNCLKNGNDAPHDKEWRKRQCSTDVANAIKEKVISCVRLRVSPDFAYPAFDDWPYGRYSYESVPLAKAPLESMCKKGNYKGAQDCFMKLVNTTMMNDTEAAGYYENACTHRAECFKILDDDCFDRYNTYRESWCECAYDVHDLYGGKRLLTLIPSCFGLIGDKKGRYVATYKERDSCKLKDLDERDYLHKMCALGYEKYKKEQREKSMVTTPKPK